MTFGIDDAIAAGLKIVNKFVSDPEQKIAAEQQLRQDLNAWDKAQSEVNKTEAASSSLFVAGWRPMIGWVCAAALAAHYLFPYASWLLTPLVTIPAPPKLDGSLWELVTAMLGFGGLRTYEKSQGLAK